MGTRVFIGKQQWSDHPQVGHTGYNPSDTQEINKTQLFYCVRDAVSLHKFRLTSSSPARRPTDALGFPKTAESVGT